MSRGSGELNVMKHSFRLHITKLSVAYRAHTSPSARPHLDALVSSAVRLQIYNYIQYLALSLEEYHEDEGSTNTSLPLENCN